MSDCLNASRGSTVGSSSSSDSSTCKTLAFDLVCFDFDPLASCFLAAACFGLGVNFEGLDIWVVWGLFCDFKGLCWGFVGLDLDFWGSTGSLRSADFDCSNFAFLIDFWVTSVFSSETLDDDIDGVESSEDFLEEVVDVSGDFLDAITISSVDLRRSAILVFNALMPESESESEQESDSESTFLLLGNLFALDGVKSSSDESPPFNLLLRPFFPGDFTFTFPTMADSRVLSTSFLWVSSRFPPSFATILSNSTIFSSSGFKVWIFSFTAFLFSSNLSLLAFSSFASRSFSNLLSFSLRSFSFNFLLSFSSLSTFSLILSLVSCSLFFDSSACCSLSFSYFFSFFSSFSPSPSLL